MYSVIILSVFLVSISRIECALPPYMTRCNIHNNISFVQCAWNNFDKVIPHLSEGIKEFHLQSFTPFHLDLIDIEATKEFKMRLKDVDIYELNIVKLKSMTIDTDKANVKFQIHFPRVVIIGQYEIDGRILILPIQGNGPANVTLEQLTVDYGFTYPIVERNGKQYVNMTNITFIFRTSHLYVQLENLFNGNKVLGDQMNEFLDTNWQEVEELIRPAMSETVVAIVSQIFQRVAGSMTAQELFEM